MASARAVVAALVEMGCTRVQLATVELEEERLRLVGLCLMAIATMFFCGVALVLLALLLVLVFWDGPRVLVMSLVTAFFVLLAAGLAWRWRVQQQRRPALLSSTLATLRADGEALLRRDQAVP
jgi:uncharacterized membrane protein YqjE